MQIIKDRQIIQDNWSFLNENAPVCSGDISVSLARWLKDRQTLLDRDGKLGLRLASSDQVEDIADDLQHFALIELDFPAFTDGRGFSQAWLLRNRYGYENELRAIGQCMPDQAFYLHRVGIDSFALENSGLLNTTNSLLDDFSVSYQPSTR